MVVVLFCVNVQIFSVVHDVLRVDLVVKIAGAEKHVNRELINMGYANEAEESHLSHVSWHVPSNSSNAVLELKLESSNLLQLICQ